VIALDPTKPLLWTIDDLCTRGECADLVARIEAAKPEAAPITTGRGFVMRPEIRNNERVIFEDADLAARLFARARSRLPETMLGRQPVSANERFRAYRYRPGQRFKAHYDGAFVRNPNEQSFITFMVYLNDDFSGGETAFLDLERVITPRIGSALFFQHHLLHEGREVDSGTKYVLRTDVMFRS
jgi:predicted 2-oxoglutarate/Fe(II)-dependent dioxygenase YbiX